MEKVIGNIDIATAAASTDSCHARTDIGHFEVFDAEITTCNIETGNAGYIAPVHQLGIRAIRELYIRFVSASDSDHLSACAADTE